MSDLKGKRLLFLGATGLMCSAVESAKRMGIYTIVTDYYSGAMAKSVADQKYDVSTTDIDTLESLARDERVDGVFTGFSDVNLYSAQVLCERLSLPFYATREQLDMATNKLKFKEMCRRYGVPTVKQYELDVRCLPEHLAKIEYPVIVKPADSYASKGVRICKNVAELREAVLFATNFSKNGSIIVERYFDPHKYSDIAAYYTIQNGDIRLSSMADRVLYVGGSGIAPLPCQLRMPSRHLKEYQKQVDEKVKSMFRAEHFANGTLFIQGFAVENQFYFFEMGFRLNGAQEYIFASHFNDNNALELYFEYALTGKTDALDMGREDPAFDQACCNVLLLLAPGQIEYCTGLDEVKKFPGVLNVTQLLKAGDTVGMQGTLGQVLARIHFVCPTWEAVDTQIDKIIGSVTVQDADGHNLLIGVKAR